MITVKKYSQFIIENDVSNYKRIRPTEDEIKNAGENYIQWQKKQLPDYVKELERLTNKKYVDKKYLSPIEIDDMVFMYAQLTKHKYKIPLSIISATLAILNNRGKLKLRQGTIEELRDMGFYIDDNYDN